MTDKRESANEPEEPKALKAPKARKPGRKKKGLAQKPTQKPTQKPAQAAARMYIGPNMGKGQLAQYTVFRGELPHHVKLLIEQTKELATLFVPVSFSAKAIQKMNMPGTVEYRAAQKVRG